MQTEKLYDADSHLRIFSAQVLSCEPAARGWEVRLDRTAFYPEGGGQPCDLGTLGGTEVTGVLERGGGIVHICAGPLAPGSVAAGEIDWRRRFDLMQQHSGEHIVSGLVHAAFGYDNVGFHMGRDVVTIDFSGELTAAQVLELEEQANAVVWDDLEIKAGYPDASVLKDTAYRSKKALTGAVRLVEIPGVDCCACCGTHVSRTGEIGLIRLLGGVKLRGGSRLELVCGGRALRHTQAVWEQTRRVSNLLSARPLQTAEAVERICGELETCRYRLTQLEDRLFEERAGDLRDAGDVLLFEEGLTADGVRRLALAAGKRCGGTAAVFSGAEHSGYQYAVCGSGGDLRELGRRLNGRLNGRGGGKPQLIQGAVQASEQEIREFFSSAVPGCQCR